MFISGLGLAMRAMPCRTVMVPEGRDDVQRMRAGNLRATQPGELLQSTVYAVSA
jgi:hypothetical protein